MRDDVCQTGGVSGVSGFLTVKRARILICGLYVANMFQVRRRFYNQSRDRALIGFIPDGNVGMIIDLNKLLKAVIITRFLSVEESAILIDKSHRVRAVDFHN